MGSCYTGEENRAIFLNLPVTSKAMFVDGFCQINPGAGASEGGGAAIVPPKGVRSSVTVYGRLSHIGYDDNEYKPRSYCAQLRAAIVALDLHID